MIKQKRITNCRISSSFLLVEKIPNIFFKEEIMNIYNSKKIY